MASRIEQIIEEIEEYIDGCKYQALSSSKIIVNKDELEELLNELRSKTPEEIKRYQKIISNKDAILADAQAKAGCNHKHTGRTWIIAEKANCNHTGRKKQLCVRCRKVLLEKVIPKTKHKWKLTRKRRTRYDCLKCGGVKLKNEYGGWSYYFP